MISLQQLKAVLQGLLHDQRCTLKNVQTALRKKAEAPDWNCNDPKSLSFIKGRPGGYMEGGQAVPFPERYLTNTSTNIRNGSASRSIQVVSAAEASGILSISLGHGTKAIGDRSVAFGIDAQAIGHGSRAFGERSIAKDWGSCALGDDSEAISPRSFTEGAGTIANGKKQGVHAQGQYNIDPGANSTLMHIVGNGWAGDRSNAHTLDFDGTAWFQGDVYVGSTSGINRDNGSKKLATEEYVDAARSAILLKSSTVDSEKVFRITVDDTGTINVRRWH